MRILYVTDLWSGLEDILCKGMREATGMPAFWRPLEWLVREGHEVDLIVIPQSRKQTTALNAGPAWLAKSRVHIATKNPLWSPFEVLWQTKRFLTERHYDFVYCHGNLSYPALVFARWRKIPTGVRKYGTLLEEKLSQPSRWGALLSVLTHLRECLVMAWPKDFLICTEDGTRGDLLHERFMKFPPAGYQFHFLRNGVERSAAIVRERCPSGVKSETPFIFYPARIDEWKRQTWAIEMVHEMHRRELPVKLYLAGHITSEPFFRELNRQILAYGLEDSVHYLGLLGPAEMKFMYRRALATGAFYELSNLGNVAIEALSAAALFVYSDSRSLHGIVEDGINGIYVRSPREGAERLVRLYHSPEASEELRRQAARRADESFLSWEERCALEHSIISRAIQKGEKQP